MKSIRIISITIVLVLAVTGMAVGQNFLTDNPYYEEAQELRRQAEQAIEDGDYEESVELSEEAQELTQQAREWAQRQLLRYQANSWTNRAQERLQEAKDWDAEEHFPDEFENAGEFYDEAESLFSDEEYEESIQASRNVIAALEDIRRVEKTQEDLKPRYYEVRLIPDRRDCFWRIAEYEFIYDDPWEWRRIYEANKDKLPDPDNPDLILPGTRLRIPSMEGEQRSGTYEPE
ncbi:MAG: LysM peptidoglycan-binding domain-containing protein [Spirochaetota bacterium]